MTVKQIESVLNGFYSSHCQCHIAAAGVLVDWSCVVLLAVPKADAGLVGSYNCIV
jgi:hypothetical protein